MTNKGDLVRFSTEFKISGSYVNPQYLQLRVRFPSGAISDYYYTPTGSSLTKEFDGKFYKDVFVTESGQWWYYWIGSGTVFGADEDDFMVDTTVF